MGSYLLDAVFNQFIVMLNAINADDYNVSHLVDQVALFRGRSIELRPVSMLGLSEYGYWLAGPTQDFVFYEADTARVHQDHIIFHELGHMLLGHQTYHVHHASDAFDAVLARSLHAETQQERDAETLATMMQHAIIRRLGLRALTQERTSNPEWTALMRSLYQSESK